MPDLKLSINEPKSYFRSFFLLLDELKLAFIKNKSNYFFKNLFTIFTMKLTVNEQVIHLFLGNYPPKMLVRTAYSLPLLLSWRSSVLMLI
jgi:hypothetical protein